MRPTPELSVVIPTQGRRTLETALGSIRSQADADTVEIIVVGDLYNPPNHDDIVWSQNVAALFDAKWVGHNAGFSHWGHPQAQFAQFWTQGERLMFIGDDDWFLDGAIATILATPPGLTLYRINNHKRGAVIWEQPHLSYGNVSAQNFVVRNDDKSKLGVWGIEPDRGGDWRFICSTAERWGVMPDWREEVIVECA